MINPIDSSVILIAESETDVCKARSLSAVGILSKVLWVDTLQHTEIFVNFDAFVEVVGHLGALRHLVRSQQSVIVQTLHVSAFIGQTGKFLVGLDWDRVTLY